MLIRSALALALLAGSAHAADFSRSLTVGNCPDLYVSNGSGDIHIFAGSDMQVHIQAHVSSNWQLFGSNAEDRIHRIERNPPIRQSGNEIRVGDIPAEDRSLFNNITIDYEISVPRSTALNLHQRGGRPSRRRRRPIPEGPNRVGVCSRLWGLGIRRSPYGLRRYRA